MGRADGARPCSPSRGTRAGDASVAFSPDGTRIVTGSQDRTAKVWDARTGDGPARPQGAHGRGASAWRSARTARGSSPAVTTGRRRCGTRGRGRALLALKGHTGVVSSASFSPDGTRIVTGSDGPDGEGVGRAGPGAELLTLKGHTDRGASAWRSARTARASSPASEDETAKVWDAQTGRRAARPSRGTRARSIGVSFSPDGTRIVTGSGDKTAKVWDARTGRRAPRPSRGTRAW